MPLPHCITRSLGALLMVSTTAGAAPPPGHPSAEEALAQLGVMPSPAAAELPELPFRGTVLAARDANAFTYLQVMRDSGDTEWIACPRIAVQAGDRIAFDAGRRLAPFHSRKLNVTFDAVSFVNQVQVFH